MEVHAIVYHGRLAALSSFDGVDLAPHIEALEHDHPIARWVRAMCLYSEQVHGGKLARPYRCELAQYFAQLVLIDGWELRMLEDLDDTALAEYFNVPLEQIALRREDLLLEPGPQPHLLAAARRSWRSWRRRRCQR